MVLNSRCTGLKIRQLRPADAPVAASLVRQFRGDQIAVPYLERLLQNPANFLIVAETDGALLGFLFAHCIDRLHREETHYFIYELEVAPNRRRQGIGTALVRYLRNVAEREGVEAFVLTNHSNRAAVSFYQATGARIENGDDLLFVYPSQ
jgi:ribosomal protein S18 acetylase RimI-like enzyme